MWIDKNLYGNLQEQLRRLTGDNYRLMEENNRMQAENRELRGETSALHRAIAASPERDAYDRNELAQARRELERERQANANLWRIIEAELNKRQQAQDVDNWEKMTAR